MGFKRIVIVMIVLATLGLTAFASRFSSRGEAAKAASVEMENYEAIGEIADYEPIVVLELFTSQGCSSCPPADVLLNKVGKENENTVFALSYHVDYWNYIGWKDPFSSSEYTEKQRDYNIKLKSRSNYTPEMIVNGKEHFVGSDGSKVDRAIQKYSTMKSANKVTLSDVNADQNSISFEYAVLGDTKNRNLRAVLVLDERTTEVKRGENKNRTLKNSNIVVAEKSIGIEHSEGKSFMAIPEMVYPDEKISLILLAENEVNDITGAAKAGVER